MFFTRGDGKSTLSMIRWLEYILTLSEEDFAHQFDEEKKKTEMMSVDMRGRDDK